MLSVVIVNFNTREHLRACLQTVERENPVETIVVDNASTDGSAEMVRAEFPNVILFANDENIGHSAGANQGIVNCKGEYALLLNSDTRLFPNSLRSLKAYMDQHPQAAIVGPRLVNPDGSLQASCYPLPTPLYIFLEESTLGRLIRFIPGLRNLYLRSWPHDSDRVVPWVLGAALAIRRDAFLSVAGFDESFHLYSNEIDLCLRLGKEGWQTHFTPRATITHYGGASTRQLDTHAAEHYFSSLIKLYQRYYSPHQLSLIIGIMKSIVFARLLRDKVRHFLSSDHHQRKQIASDIAAWQHILHH